MISFRKKSDQMRVGHHAHERKTDVGVSCVVIHGLLHSLVKAVQEWQRNAVAQLDGIVAIDKESQDDGLAFF